MGDRQTDFFRALEALSGREPPSSGIDPRVRAEVERFLERVGAVGREPAVPRSAARRALSVFRKSRKAASAPLSLLRLVFDSWLEPAPAVRRATPQATRFLRFEGACRLELQTRETPHGVELFGQIDPSDAVSEVVLEFEGKDRRAAVDAVGSFRFARLRHGAARLRIGETIIEDVPL